MLLDKYVLYVVKLFMLLDICVCLCLILDDFCFSVEDIGEFISVDFFFIVKVLRLVNSLLFWFFF